MIRTIAPQFVLGSELASIQTAPIQIDVRQHRALADPTKLGTTQFVKTGPNVINDRIGRWQAPLPIHARATARSPDPRPRHPIARRSFPPPTSHPHARQSHSEARPTGCPPTHSVSAEKTRWPSQRQTDDCDRSDRLCSTCDTTDRANRAESVRSGAASNSCCASANDMATDRAAPPQQGHHLPPLLRPTHAVWPFDEPLSPSISLIHGQRASSFRRARWRAAYTEPAVVWRRVAKSCADTACPSSKSAFTTACSNVDRDRMTSSTSSSRSRVASSSSGVARASAGSQSLAHDSHRGWDRCVRSRLHGPLVGQQQEPGRQRPAAGVETVGQGQHRIR